VTLAPKLARELSWAASKLREVAKVLERHRSGLTSVDASDSMNGLESVEQGVSDASPGVGDLAEPSQLTLTWKEYSDAVRACSGLSEKGCTG